MGELLEILFFGGVLLKLFEILFPIVTIVLLCILNYKVNAIITFLVKQKKQNNHKEGV